MCRCDLFGTFAERAMNSEIREGRLYQTLSARLDFYLVDIEKLLEICNYGLDIRKLNF